MNPRTNAGPSDLELLGIELEASLDRRGRLVDCHGITIASCEHGQALWIGADVPEPLATRLTAAFDRASPPDQPARPPPALDLCEAILGSAGVPWQRASGPSYVIPPDTTFASAVALVRSDQPGVDRLRSANPGNWHPVEWDELLDGRLGPWVIATDGDRAISICHTPRPATERAAECGVWTDPQFRGHGHAAATASAWVALVRSPGRHLFYSHDAANESSRRVAQRLGLREIGWTWRVHRPRDDHDEQVHPLCSLRRRASPDRGSR